MNIKTLCLWKCCEIYDCSIPYEYIIDCSGLIVVTKLFIGLFYFTDHEKLYLRYCVNILCQAQNVQCQAPISWYLTLCHAGTIRNVFSDLRVFRFQGPKHPLGVSRLQRLITILYLCLPTIITFWSCTSKFNDRLVLLIGDTQNMIPTCTWLN